jgi:formylglycine-generating enzyme required for sulfatase activity
MMKSGWFVIPLVVAFFSSYSALAVTISTVPIGNPSNSADTRFFATGFGAVAYAFHIGKYEVTNGQYVEFLNAVDPTGANTLGLYSSNMTTSSQGGINFTSEAFDGSKYSVKNPALGGSYRYNDKPVVYVNWFDAIRFSNWLHNGQGSGDTETGAYTLLGGTPTPLNSDSIERNPGARWFIPSENEWYKAAYHKNDGSTGNYWGYPTRTDNEPDNNLPTSDTGNSVNYRIPCCYTTGNSSFPMTDVGAYTQSSSPYGTYDQGGNVWEWTRRYSLSLSAVFAAVRGPAVPSSYWRQTGGVPSTRHLSHRSRTTGLVFVSQVSRSRVRLRYSYLVD